MNPNTILILQLSGVVIIELIVALLGTYLILRWFDKKNISSKSQKANSEVKG